MDLLTVISKKGVLLLPSIFAIGSSAFMGYVNSTLGRYMIFEPYIILLAFSFLTITVMPCPW